MSLVPDHISSLLPYIAGKPIEQVKRELGLNNIIKLASNENPIGPSLLALNALKYNNISLNRYPDSSSFYLRTKLSQKFNVDIDNVILGSGSEGIMSSIMRTFLSKDDEIIATKNSFIGFRVLANASGFKTHWVDMKDYSYDLIAMSRKINKYTKLVYLANPDNPTGTYFNNNQFDEFMLKISDEILVILDEAYFEYANDQNDYPDSMLYRYDNVITLRTFSKIYGLAGLRIGYGFSHKNLISNLMKVKLPFEPSIPAQIAAQAALDDIKHLEKSLIENQFNKLKLYKYFQNNNIRYIPSYTNFITIILKNEKEATFFCENMLINGIILRHLKGFGLSACIRITIGNSEEIKYLINNMDKYSF